MNKFRVSPLSSRPRTDFSGLIGDLPDKMTFASEPIPTPQSPEQQPASQPQPEPISHPINPETLAKLAELSSVLGLAKAFSNHSELRDLLGKIQIKLTAAGRDSDTISEAALSGIENCLIYFGRNLPPQTESSPTSENKAGAFLNFSSTLANSLHLHLLQLPGLHPERQMLQKFLLRLRDLLALLERYEYKESKIN